MWGEVVRGALPHPTLFFDCERALSQSHPAALSSHTSLAPGLLIASPKLDGSTFERAVIVMVHHDEGGAMGFILNKPLTVDLGSLLETADEALEGPIDERCFDVAVRFGGPVRVEQLWLIYRDLDEESETPQAFEALEQRGSLQFHKRWCVVADSESIEAFLYGQRDDPFRPFIGYTGWGPGQLEEELEEGSWLFLEFQEDLIFDDRDADDCWDDALARLGVAPMAFLMMGKVARD